MTVPLSPRIFIRTSGQGFDVLCRIPHEMSSERYLTQVAFRRNDELHAELLLGRHVAEDPVVGTSFATLESGDQIAVSWQDIGGLSGEIRRVFDGSTD